MAITTVGFGSTSVASTGTVFPPWATGHDVDDIGLAFVETSGDTPASLNLARGFALLGSSVSAGSSALTRLDVFWCRATSSAMNAPVFNAQADHQWSVMGVWRGVSTTEQPGLIISTPTGDNTGTATTFTMPSVTTTVPNSLVINATSVSADTAGNPLSGWSNANSNTITNAPFFGTGAGDGGLAGIGYFVLASPGASGATTVNSSIASGYAPMSLVLVPPAVPALGSFFPFFL